MTTPSTAPPPDEAPSDALPKEGDILAGKYRLETVLGQGGMGVVVAARHTTLQQKVAIKILLPEAAKRTDAAQRFVREARAAVRIQNEHVARVSDVGTLENGLPYMVMEFLTGQDLGVLLGERGPLPVAEAVDYVLQACEAIAEAHAIGIIHRDLKPANLFLSQRTDGSPLIKVLDFGLSKATRPDALDASLTAHNVVMGSPCYMSPEQIRSLKGLDARTDIWALGVILYQLLTGVRPFEAPSLGALFFTIGADPPKPLRDRRPEIPRELEAAVLKCLEKDASRRTQTVAELARALSPFGKQDSYISVDRIHRVLSDATPMPTRRALSEAPHGLPSTIPDDDDDVDDNAATILQPVAPLKADSLRPPPPPLLAPPPPPPPQPATVAAAPSPPEAPASSAQVKSGSMAAIARDGSSPPPPDTHAPAPRRSGLATVAIAIALVAVGGVAGLGLRTVTTPSTPGDASHSPPQQAAQPVTMGEAPKPSAQPVPTVAVQAAPSPSPATTVVPSASASAAPAPSTSASAKPPAPAPKK
jgi:serine/threonine-protein kinase